MALTLRIEENPEAQKALANVQDVFEEKSASKAIYAALEYTSKINEHNKSSKELKQELFDLERKMQTLQNAVGNFVSSFERLQDIRLQN